MEKNILQHFVTILLSLDLWKLNGYSICEYHWRWKNLIVWPSVEVLGAGLKKPKKLLDTHSSLIPTILGVSNFFSNPYFSRMMAFMSSALKNLKARLNYMESRAELQGYSIERACSQITLWSMYLVSMNEMKALICTRS